MRIPNFCRALCACVLACCLSLLQPGICLGQKVVVLPGNGSFTKEVSPQGSVRYQRGFYLMTPAEMKKSGLTSGMVINAIGFTIGVPQPDTTKGRFKVYLQNTTHSSSRSDTSWTTVNTNTNQFNVTGIVPGNYEWQVQANCSATSPFSPVVSFSNASLGGCNQTYNLSTENVTSNTATLKWDAIMSGLPSRFLVEYTRADSLYWFTDTVNGTSYSAINLLPGKFYQWKVSAVCALTSSSVSSATFVTGTPVNCNGPANLATVVSSDTSAKLTWTAAAGATRYEVQYRRSGTSNWTNALAFTNSLTLPLPKGTTYEWQVRTVCTAGSGAYVAGPNFTTGGNLVCYAPENVLTRLITGSSARFTWNSVAGASSYTVRYRLKNTISWTSATTPMTLVSDGEITIPKTPGSYDVPFANGPAFTYTGEGLYVAWEYARPTGLLPSSNVSIATTAGSSITGINGQDSIPVLLSFSGISDSTNAGFKEILTSRKERPETRLGSAALRDSVVVDAVYTLGFTAPEYQSPTIITALIRNATSAAQTLAVTLKVKDQKTGTIRYTESQNISIAAASADTVKFTGWTPVINERDSIIVTLPIVAGENVVNNNSNYYVQTVGTSTIAYDDGSPAITTAGTGKTAGVLLTKYDLKGCGKINAAEIYLTESAKGVPLYAVVRSLAGAIVAQSTSFTPDSSEVNTYHTFYFNTPPALKDETFFVGLAQNANLNAIYPVGVQYENATRKGAYYKSDIDGSNLVDTPQAGRLMIRAAIVPSAPVVYISGKLSLCTNATNTLTAASADARYANRVLSFSSQNSNVSYSALQALGSPNVYPANTFSTLSWISKTPDAAREYLELGFPSPAPVNFVDVYETTNPGSVDTVFVKNPATGLYEVVFSAPAKPAAVAARINHITFPLTTFAVSEIRIAFNSLAVPGYSAVDAVSIGEQKDPAIFSSYLWSPGGQTTPSITINTPGTYTLTVTGAGGCTQSASATVFNAVQITPTITATRPTTFCLGDSTILKSSQKGGNVWSNGATTDSIVVKTAGSYTVTYTDASGCGGTVSAATAVTVNALPTVNISGQLTFCAGTSTTLDAGAGYSTYLWSTGATTRTISVNRAGQYYVQVTNATGCKGSGSVSVSIAASLSPSVSGNLLFCPGSFTTLDAGDGYSGYVWSTGATTRTINTTTPGSYSVTVTNSAGCSGSATVNVGLAPKPNPVITGNSEFCPGGSTTLDAGAGYVSYLWNTGATTQTINVSSTGTYSVTVTNASGCSGTASVSTSNYTAPSPAITGATTFCPGSATTLSGAAGFNSYLWSNGSGTQSIAVNTPATYTLTVTDSRGCTGSNSVAVTQLTAPTPVISGNTTFCGGSNTTLDAGSGYSSYLWNTGATTKSILANSVATYSVTVTDAGGCTGSASVTTVQTSNIPVKPGPISGQNQGVCGSANYTYSIDPVPNTSRYVWTVPTGATITSGQGTTSITVMFAANFTTGNIVVAASNACGQSASIDPRFITVQSATGAPGPITGSITGVCGKSGVQYSVAPVPFAASYLWTVPAGATISSGQGTSTITVNFNASFSTGSICVSANSGCGASVGSCTKISAVPLLASSIAGPATVCSKQQGIVYSVPAVSGATSYTWTLPAQATITAGANTNSITVKFGAKGGLVTVKANNACGSSEVQSLNVSLGACAVAGQKEAYTVDQRDEPLLNVKVLPNPFHQTFTLVTRSTSKLPVNIRIADGLGRVVTYKTGLPSNATVTLGEYYANGVYYAEVTQGTKRITLKLIKQPD